MASAFERRNKMLCPMKFSVPMHSALQKYECEKEKCAWWITARKPNKETVSGCAVAFGGTKPGENNWIISYERKK